MGSLRRMTRAPGRPARRSQQETPTKDRSDTPKATPAPTRTSTSGGFTGKVIRFNWSCFVFLPAQRIAGSVRTRAGVPGRFAAGAGCSSDAINARARSRSVHADQRPETPGLREFYVSTGSSPPPGRIASRTLKQTQKRDSTRDNSNSYDPVVYLLLLSWCAGTNPRASQMPVEVGRIAACSAPPQTLSARKQATPRCIVPWQRTTPSRCIAR